MCQLGKVKDAEKEFDHALSISDEDNYDALLNIAIAFENARSYDLSIKYLVQALEQEPESLTVLYDLGYYHDRVHKFRESVDFYMRYLDRNNFV